MPTLTKHNFRRPVQMRPHVQRAILTRLVSRIRTGTTFVEFVYLERYKTPDAAWIRNIYILLSFYTELLLKAIYVYEKKHGTKIELDNVFRQQGHKLERIANDIGATILAKYGIYEVKSMRTKECRIKTDIGAFYVKDFVDIRYDFIDGRVRKLTGREHDMFKIQIVAINRIAAFLNGPAWV